MHEAEYPAVLINQDALKQRNAGAISDEMLRKVFNQPNLVCFSSVDSMKQYLLEMDPKGRNLLLMSSGNYGGINLVSFADKFLYK